MGFLHPGLEQSDIFFEKKKKLPCGIFFKIFFIEKKGGNPF